MKRVFFDAIVDGEFCNEKCPRLTGMLDGVPKFVRAAYPHVRKYVCQFFGPLSEPHDDGEGFKIQRARRAQACIETSCTAEEVKEKKDG